MLILQVCAYGAPYPGNFINSLLLLEEKLSKKGHKTIYAFSESAKGKKWCEEIQSRTKVYFLPVSKARVSPKTYNIFREIYKDNKIDIVHSHFELYDIPATIFSNKNTTIFWHLHDSLTKTKKVSRNILNKLQYSVFSKKANLISVSEYYRNKIVDMGFDELKTCTVLNGIDLSRIEDCKGTNKPFNFLTFGWDFYRKGSDIIFQSMEKLYQDGYRFKLLFVGIPETKEKVEEYFNGKLPVWLEFSKPTVDVNMMYKKADIFIQASRRETFSYAVCEAAYAGLPVIASNIPGLDWARNVPLVKFFESENVEQLYVLLKKYVELDFNISKSDVDYSNQIIKENFSLEVWTQNIIERYSI